VNESPPPAPSKRERWLYWGAWVFSLGLLACAAYLGWIVWTAQTDSPIPAQAAVETFPTKLAESSPTNVAMPVLEVPTGFMAISRQAYLHTIIPTRPRQEVQLYKVQAGDSVFAIAQSFGLKPESILWANYDLLNDNPDQLSLDMELKIPPTDGVLHEWREGESIQAVADRFKAKVEDIISWSGNRIDLTNPSIEPGTLVMVPGGHREFRQWLVPTIPRGRAGVSTTLLGAGACPGGYEGAFGTGGFVWPADNHYVVGNDYWSGHLGIDIAAGMGASIYAADSGVVVFAGPAFGGYGNMIMIDHGNGYQTLYAHLSSVRTHCGASVSQGQRIGASGSTGNSSGPHLHFEVRYMSGFINPWLALPPP
jgi:murein DD-endopeptidase MepM/ murein hydrolase activator NlpD